MNANPKLQSVQAVNVVNSGAGYTVLHPTGSRFSGGGTSGAGAAATATIGDGVVGLVTITAGGSGYTENPAITFTGVSTVSAAVMTPAPQSLLLLVECCWNDFGNFT